MALAIVLGWALSATSAAGDLTNADFSRWTDGAPDGWTVDIGATNGADRPVSKLNSGEGAGLVLSGDASTRAWQVVSQSFEVPRGAYLRISVTAGAFDVRREGRQFDNCYVGFTLHDDDGNVHSRNFVTPQGDIQTEHRYVRVPDQAGTWTIDATIFLSKTGKLEVQNIELIEYVAEDSFDLLVAEMDLHYSHFSTKEIDWHELTDAYRPRVEAEPERFTELIIEMLGELEDMHIWVDRTDGRRIPTHRSSYEANFHPRGQLARDLETIADIPNLGRFARTADGFGVIQITALQADRAGQQALIEAMDELMDTPGMIIDLRRNSGGAEGLAQYIASYFTSSRRAYAGSKVRAGPAHEDFTDVRYRYIEPHAEQDTYAGPVVCLIGPGCVSSGEGMAMMFNSIPNIILAGQPTRGASGNPQPLPLPNGIDVWYSRWVSLLPDGTPIEGIGIQPKVEIEHDNDPDRFDPTFARGVEMLQEELEHRR